MKEKKQRSVKHRSVKQRRQKGQHGKAIGPVGLLLAYVAMMMLWAGGGNLGYEWEIATTSDVQHTGQGAEGHVVSTRVFLDGLREERELFEQIDSNGDGLVDLQEFLEDDEDGQEYFEDMDDNGDGSIVLEDGGIPRLP